MAEDDDDTDPPNGNGHHVQHGPPGQRPVSVAGGEIGARLRDVEARLVSLDCRDTEQHAALVERLDALTRGVEEVGGRLVAGMAALEEAHRRTVTLRVLHIAETAVERMLTPAAAPILAACLLVGVVAVTATSIQWGSMSVGQVASAANVDSDEGGDMPAPVTAAP